MMADFSTLLDCLVVEGIRLGGSASKFPNMTVESKDRIDWTVGDCCGVRTLEAEPSSDKMGEGLDPSVLFFREAESDMMIVAQNE